MVDVSVRATLEGFAAVDTALKKTAQGIDSVADAQTKSLQASLAYADAWKRQHQPIEAASEDIQRILGKYDPLGTKLRQLQSDFSNLDKAIMFGKTGGTSDIALDKTMRALNEEIAKTKGLMDVAGGAVAATGTSMASLGLNTRRAQQELMMLGREALSGNFSQMPMTFTRLVMHTNLWSLALNPVVLGFAAVTAAVSGGLVIFDLASREITKMNNALVMTSNFAGMTQEQMSRMARAVADTTTLTVGASREVVTQIVASGQYSAANVGRLAAMVGDYAAAVGKDVEKVTPELIKMFEDPAKASEALNRQYGYLTVVELERIRTLQRSGDVQGAVTLALEAFSAHIPKAVDDLTSLGKAFHLAEKAGSDFWLSLKNATLALFRVPGLDEQIQGVKATIEQLKAYQLMSGNASVNAGAIAAQQALLAALQKQVVARAEVADMLGRETQTLQAQNKAQEEINKSTLNRIDKLVAERDFIINNGVASVEKDRRVLELNKEIRDLRRGMFAEDAARINENYAHELKLFDISIKRTVAQIDAVLKLGRLSEEEANKQKLQAQLELNFAQRLATVKELSNRNLTANERAQLEHKLEQQKAEAQTLMDAGEFTEQLTEQVRLDKEAERTYKQINADLEQMTSILNKQGEAQRSLNISIEKQIADEEFKLSLIGKTAAEQTLLIALRKLDLDYQAAGLARSGEMYEMDRTRLARAVQANADASKEINQFWKTAAKDMQRSMSSFFFDIMQGNLKDLAGSFKRTIDRMVADALAAKAALALFGPDFTKPGSTAPIGGLIGQGLGFLGGVFGGGGSTASMAAAAGNSGAMEGALLGAFAGGGSFTVGGSGGTDSKFVGFKATPGERVTVQTPGQQGQRDGARIVVNNVFNVSGAVDRRSQAQIAAAAGEGVQRALARNT